MWHRLFLRDVQQCRAGLSTASSCVSPRPQFILPNTVNTMGVDPEDAFLAGEDSSSWPADCCHATMGNLKINSLCRALK